MLQMHKQGKQLGPGLPWEAGCVLQRHFQEQQSGLCAELVMNNLLLHHA